MQEFSGDNFLPHYQKCLHNPHIPQMQCKEMLHFLNLSVYSTELCLTFLIYHSIKRFLYYVFAIFVSFRPVFYEIDFGARVIAFSGVI